MNDMNVGYGRRMTCCKDCTDRQVGCHANCERYIEDKKRRHAETEAVKKAKKKNYIVYDGKKRRKR